ncbi:MAG TPA: sugar phosphate isomerase/epimerase family protein [Hyphomicrobiaceae bacterium]|nr:sugar phosphate isomerase/epimerase family protein [Hyphomicrobiaceae bacterium]
MRICLCNEVVRELSFERQCAFARAVGYDGLEIAPFTLGEDPHLLPSARRSELRAAAAAEGMAITSLHYLMLAPPGLSITSEARIEHQRSIEVMCRLCDLAADLGARLLVHGSPAQRRLEVGREAEGRKRAVAAFAAAAEAAGNAGVTYCIEPLAATETKLINTVEDAAAIVREIGHPALRTMIDCCAAARAESQSLPQLLAHWLPTGIIAHIHFNDPNRRGPGEGELGFAPILGALRAGGYQGVAAVEPFLYQPDGPTCAARAIGYLRGLQAQAQA